MAITITQPEAGTDNGAEVGMQQSGRSLRRFGRQKMNVAGNADGSITVTPDTGNELLVVGDPAMGEVEIVEVRPAEPVE